MKQLVLMYKMAFSGTFLQKTICECIQAKTMVILETIAMICLNLLETTHNSKSHNEPFVGWENNEKFKPLVSTSKKGVYSVFNSYFLCDPWVKNLHSQVYFLLSFPVSIPKKSANKNKIRKQLFGIFICSDIFIKINQINK